MNHSFNIEIAQSYGIEEAIILENLYFWIEKNKANYMHYCDGHYWTYNSINAFQKLFPYMSVSKIRRVLEKLENEGLVITGNYNKIAYDRTKWYALTTKALSIYDSSICQNEQMEKPKVTNQFAAGDEPIPDINTDINTDINQIKDTPSQITERNTEMEQKSEFESIEKTEIEPSKQQAFDFVQWFYDNMDKPTRYKNKAPDLTKWVEPIDRLLRIDKVEYTEMKRVALFALRDDFWKTNILSTANFRKHYDKLEKQSRVKTQKKGVTNTIDQDEFYRLYGGGQ